MILNGWDIVGSLAERYPVMISLASGEMSEEAFAEWLRAHARPDQVSEPSPGYG